MFIEYIGVFEGPRQLSVNGDVGTVRHFLLKVSTNGSLKTLPTNRAIIWQT